MLPGLSWVWVLLAAIALHSLGCTDAPAQPARLGLRLAPATLGVTLSLQQHLSIERQGRVDELDAALEIDPERLDMVGLALGQRILALHYDGRSLQSWRHPLVPEQLRGEDVLEDLQLMLWPIEVIEQALPAGWSIAEDGRRRTLRLADQPVLVIDYSGEPRWSGKIELTNLRYRYRLTIQSISSTP
ncbi:MAG: DUF3261 domain-containing protein [Candidatus Binatia bacterium]